MMYKKVIEVFLCCSLLTTLTVSHSTVIVKNSVSQNELASGNGTTESRREKRQSCTAAYLIEPTTSFECPMPTSLIMTCRFFAPANLLGEQVTIKWFFSINMGRLNFLQQSVFNGAVNAAYESRIEVLNPSIGIYFCETEVSGPIYRSEKLSIVPSIHCGGARTPQPPAPRCVSQGQLVPTIQPTTNYSLLVTYNFNRGHNATEMPRTQPMTTTTTTTTMSTTSMATDRTTAIARNGINNGAVTAATLARTVCGASGILLKIICILGAAAGGLVAIGVAIILTLIIIWRWKVAKKWQERPINDIKSNIEPLLTLPPSKPPPRPPALNSTPTESIQMNIISPLPLPYERVVSQTNGRVKLEDHGRLPEDSIMEESLDSCRPRDIPNIYSKMKFYKSQAKKGRGFSTSTHTYGDFDYGTSAESNSYITTDEVSKAWVRAKANLPKKVRGKEVHKALAAAKTRVAIEGIDRTSEEDCYMDVVDFNSEEEEIEEYVEEDDEAEVEIESEIDDGINSESDEEVESEIENHFKVSRNLFKNKNPETGESKMLHGPSKSAPEIYVNIRDRQPVDEVAYVNTCRTTIGHVKPIVPVRQKKLQNISTTTNSPEMICPPRIKTRRNKQNQNTPHSGKYMALKTDTLNSTSIYSDREISTNGSHA